MLRWILAITTVALFSVPACAQTVALLLFDGETGSDFYGCLNCSQYASESVCNEYGLYGSEYSSNSIWNEYSSVGSEYSSQGVWNEYASNGGLRIVDEEGNYYGMLTANQYSSQASRLPLAQAIMDAYREVRDLGILRDALCQ